MFSAKLTRAASVKLSIPAMFSDETRRQLSASVLRRYLPKTVAMLMKKKSIFLKIQDLRPLNTC